jgi:hypothetical protein
MSQREYKKINVNTCDSSKHLFPEIIYITKSRYCLNLTLLLIIVELFISIYSLRSSKYVKYLSKFRCIYALNCI